MDISHIRVAVGGLSREISRAYPPEVQSTVRETLDCIVMLASLGSPDIAKMRLEDVKSLLEECDSGWVLVLPAYEQCVKSLN